MTKITNDTILDTIYDLADANGVRIDVFIDKIVEEFGDRAYPTEGLPEEIVNELTDLREQKRLQRASDRMKREQESANEEIKRFRALFPEVAAEEIPDTVWAEVEGGIPLSYAYAYHLANEKKEANLADIVNARNNVSAAITGDFATEPEFTREIVERMSDREVKRNFKNILKAMNSWKV